MPCTTTLRAQPTCSVSHALHLQAALDGPRDRPFTINDASIGFPYLPSTVPYWVVIVVSVLAFVGSILVAELVLARRLHASATDAAAAALFFFLDGLSAFFMSALVTEVRWCSRGLG